MSFIPVWAASGRGAGAGGILVRAPIPAEGEEGDDLTPLEQATLAAFGTNLFVLGNTIVEFGHAF